MSIAQQLTDLNNIKTDIRNSISEKGIPIDSSTPFNQYSLRINDAVLAPEGNYHQGFGFNSQLNALVFDGSKNLYVGGNFTSYGNVSQRYLIRLKPDGTKDTAFDISSGFNNNVNCLALDSSNYLYVGGSFTTYKGATQNRLIRLKSDGSKDLSFDVSAATGSGFNSTVNAIILDSSNGIYAGGQFTTYKGIAQWCFVKLTNSGSKDPVYDVSGTDFNNGVASFAFDSSNFLYVGGYFGSFKGDVSANRLVRLKADGNKDPNFTLGVRVQSGTVYTLLVDPSNYCYMGGGFTTHRDLMDSSLYNFLRLKNNGDIDTSYDVSTSFPDGVQVNSIIRDSSNHLYLGGSFVTYKGIPQKQLVRLNSDSAVDTTFDVSKGFLHLGTPSIYTLILDASNYLYAGGNLTSYSNAKYYYTYGNFLRLKNDGKSDTTFS